MKAAGVNPVDTYIREGGNGYKQPPLPYTPGNDGAGIVEQVGEQLVGKFKVGQRVYTTQNAITGTYAEQAVVQGTLANVKDGRSGGTFPLPDSLDFAQGAAIGVPYYTAYRALKQLVNAKAGETVLVHGASGAVGVAACQIASRMLGLNVIGTAGTEEGLKMVSTACGAHHVVNHREKDYVQKINELAKTTPTGQIDIIVEMLGNVNIVKDIEMIGKRGRIAVVGSRGPTQLDLRPLMGKEAAIYGVMQRGTTAAELEEAATAINNGLADGKLVPVIDKTYPLEKAADSHKDVINSKGAKGKLVLLM